MDIHAQRAKLSWHKALSPGTELITGVAFQRTRSLLVSEPNAVGPRVRFGYQIEELGPDSQFSHRPGSEQFPLRGTGGKAVGLPFLLLRR